MPLHVIVYFKNMSLSINVTNLYKTFTYYKKPEGLKGSFKALFKREKLYKDADMERIEDFIIDILKAREEGRNPWAAWQERLPSSYFEKRWGAAWQDKDKAFWKTFRAGLKAR